MNIIDSDGGWSRMYMYLHVEHLYHVYPPLMSMAASSRGDDGAARAGRSSILFVKQMDLHLPACSRCTHLRFSGGGPAL